MLAKRLKVSDDRFCSELSDRWAHVKMCQQNLSSVACQPDCQTDSPTHNQTTRDLAQAILFLTKCKSRNSSCQSCPHKCPLCGLMVRGNDQTSVSSESHTDHACVDCLLLLSVSTLSMALTDPGHDDHHSCNGLTQIMEWCLLRGNQHLAYAASRCVLSAVATDAIKVEELQNCMERLLQELGSLESKHEEGQPSWRAATVLDLFVKLLSSMTEEATKICVDLLQKHWSYLSSRFLQPEPADLQINAVAVLAFLSLWKKLLNISSTCTAWFLEEGRKSCTDVLHYVTCDKTKGYVRLKALGLLDRLISCETESGADRLEGCTDSCGIADQLVDWMQAGRLSEAVCKEDRKVFGWTLIDHAAQHSCSTDALFRRKIALLCLRTISFTLTRSHHQGDWIWLLEPVLKFVTCGSESSASHSWLKCLFSEQDDDWVSAMLFVLDIHVYLKNRKVEESAEATGLAEGFNMHRCFCQFLETISHDHTVLVDLLSSPETQFLLFLLRYLKLVLVNWQDFVQVHNEPNPETLGPQRASNFGESQKAVNSSVSVCPEGDGKVVQPRGMCLSSLKLGEVVAMGTQLQVEHATGIASAQRIEAAGTASRNNLSGGSPSEMNPPELSIWPGLKLATHSPPTKLSTGSPSEGTFYHLSTRYTTVPSALPSSCDSKDLLSNDKTLYGCKKDLQANELNSDGTSPDVNIRKTRPSADCSRNASTSPEGFTSKEPDMGASTEWETSVHSAVRLDTVDTMFGDTQLDQTMSTLIRLRFGVERLSQAGLFPYNARPLLKVLQACEDHYENMDNSE